MSATATALAQRVIAGQSLWRCVHGHRPRRVYRMAPELQPAMLCALCACELADRLGFAVSTDHLRDSVRAIRLQHRYVTGWSVLVLQDAWWEEHIEDCTLCKQSRVATDLCFAGMRAFLRVVHERREVGSV